MNNISLNLRNALAALRVAESMEHPENVKAFVRRARECLDNLLVELFEAETARHAEQAIGDEATKRDFRCERCGCLCEIVLQRLLIRSENDEPRFERVCRDCDRTGPSAGGRVSPTSRGQQFDARRFS